MNEAEELADHINRCQDELNKHMVSFAAGSSLDHQIHAKLMLMLAQSKMESIEKMCPGSGEAADVVLSTLNIRKEEIGEFLVKKSREE